MGMGIPAIAHLDSVTGESWILDVTSSLGHGFHDNPSIHHENVLSLGFRVF